MRSNFRTIGRGVMALAVVAMSLAAVAVRAATPAVLVPERTKVCMVQDTVMAAPAIPVERDGKVYYGCCEMCKGKLTSDPARYTLARDPLTGATVDKATAELLSVDGRVMYFQSAANRDTFARQLAGRSKER